MPDRNAFSSLYFVFHIFFVGNDFLLSFISIISTSLADGSKVQGEIIFPSATAVHWFHTPPVGGQLCNILIIQLIRNDASNTLKHNKSWNLNAILLFHFVLDFFPLRGGKQVCYRCFFCDDLRFTAGRYCWFAGIVRSETLVGIKRSVDIIIILPTMVENSDN